MFSYFMYVFIFADTSVSNTQEMLVTRSPMRMYTLLLYLRKVLSGK